ncbi:hypothetical protein ACUOA8_21825, partial [Escherichia sp. SS-MK2]
LTHFKNMSDGINDLVTELSGNKPLGFKPKAARIC